MAISFRGAEFIGTFGEITGYKSGLAVAEDRFREIFAARGYEDLWPSDPDVWIRVGSEEVEEIFAFTLAQLGVGPPVHISHPYLYVFQRVKHDEAKLAVLESVGDAFTDFLRDARTPTIDPEPFIAAARAEHGEDGAEIASAAHRGPHGLSAAEPLERHAARGMAGCPTARRAV